MYSGPSPTSKMNLYAKKLKIVKNFLKSCEKFKKLKVIAAYSSVKS